jgi:calcium-translocating P-type ATPase
MDARSVATGVPSGRVALTQRAPSGEVAGLTAEEAARRLVRDGANVLPATARRHGWRELAAQLTHFFALLLWAAGGLAFVAGMPQLGVAIFVVVVVNAIFAFVQEERADHAAQRLRDLLPRRATVVRSGIEVDIDASELVVDDVVVLHDGDRISADVVVDDVARLSVDTSMLTGESVSVSAVTGDKLLAGTFVTSGAARGHVVATGSSTRLAQIARLTTTGKRPRAPLAIELDKVVRIVAFMAVGVGLGFFVLSLLIGEAARDGFLFGIGVTVALVPEGLLPTVTLALAIGAQRMARQNALVRRLESVETLGSTTFICTDKTGTLTRNEMSVVAVWTPAATATATGVGYDPAGTVEVDGARASVERAALAAWWCSPGTAVEDGGRWRAKGEPMDAAVDVFVRRLGVAPSGTVVQQYPFDATRRRTSAIVALADGRRWLFVKGAPETVFARSDRADGDEHEALEALARRGLRVLAVAGRELAPGDDRSDPDDLERELVLFGLLGFEDPPRDGTADAVARCRAAGIKIAMLTGDHAITAAAIADRIGLRRPGDPVLDGSNLPTDDAVLGALIDRDGVVVSRVTPEDKLRIATALRTRGNVVAMTGDGVNDGPALHASDIGIAMGEGGTDVAREAADLVLLDDEFRTIVAAVAQGRATFANARRFLTYHLTDNVAELTPFVLWALSGGRFPLALGVLQILCLDIGTDLLPALALGAEPSHPHPDELPALDGPLREHRRRHLFDRVVLRRAFGRFGPTEAVIEIGAFLASLAASGWRPGESFPTGVALATASGAAFTAVVIGQMANAFACRSTMVRPGALGWTSNKLLLFAVAVELSLLVGFLYIGPVADVLDHRGPSFAGFAVALLAAPAVFAVDAFDKRRAGRHR